MKILAIETSCDETAVAVLKGTGSKVEVASEALYSQIEVHKEYGGVFPNLAKREHQINLVPLLRKVLGKNTKSEIRNTKQTQSNKIRKIEKTLEREPELLKRFPELYLIPKPKIDKIAVTTGPGLEPALWVGINFAKALSVLWDVPVVGINHMEGHIVASLWDKNRIQKKDKFPAVALLVSGGHTEIIEVKDIGKYKVIGKTRDDAAGEAFDKTARILGLPYPGGPEISKLATKARKSEIDSSSYALPRPMITTPDLDFSFSGLKTAVLYMVQKIKDIDDSTKELIAKEFEDAAIDVLIAKTRKAIINTKSKALIVGGGVSANEHLRKELRKLCRGLKVSLHLPKRRLATDNAVMIGIAGYLNAHSRRRGEKLVAEGNLQLTNR